MRGNQPRDRHTPGKMRLEGFIFDCDGTLADTMPLVMSSFRQALARHLERPWKDADFISLFGLTEKGIFKTLSPDRLALADLFDAVETGSDERPNKPGAIQKVLAGWGARPDRVVYVGDATWRRPGRPGLSRSVPPGSRPIVPLCRPRSPRGSSTMPKIFSIGSRRRSRSPDRTFAADRHAGLCPRRVLLGQGDVHVHSEAVHVHEWRRHRVRERERVRERKGAGDIHLCILDQPRRQTEPPRKRWGIGGELPFSHRF